jgi:hypothetical protein
MLFEGWCSTVSSGAHRRRKDQAFEKAEPQHADFLSGFLLLLS